ncbi:MAG: DUF3800 domain-containing protein [Dehalococcoidia bacterium]|nr:DUF3800 domain-containing protein [Dehalococcoidia bacterium]MSQ17381.1 DUF3800 domain-containing protein [Dehalococcoidia bacterium]
MFLVFLGESGNTGASANDSNQPYHVHLGLMVHERQSISINGEFTALWKRHFGRSVGDPETPKSLRPADLYQGRGFFKSWSPQKRAELIQDCLGIMVRRETPVIVTYIDKREFVKNRGQQDSPSSLWKTPAEPAISRFLFALNMYIDEMNMNSLSPNQIADVQNDWPISDYALVVAGQGKSVEPKFMNQFLRTEGDMPSPALLENFCFVKAEDSVCTQLADLCAYFVRRWLQNPSGANAYFDALRDGRVIQVVYPVQL